MNYVFIKMYSDSFIERFGMNDWKAYSTPAETGLVLRTCNLKNVENNVYSYRKLVGSLMFLSIVSRPDISYSVNYLNRFLNSF